MAGYMVKIDGMSCEHCVAHVRGALEGIGASKVHILLNDGTAEFAAECAEETIRSAIEEEGYEVKEIKKV